jgi:hypothetical protein
VNEEKRAEIREQVNVEQARLDALSPAEREQARARLIPIHGTVPRVKPEKREPDLSSLRTGLWPRTTTEQLDIKPCSYGLVQRMEALIAATKRGTGVRMMVGNTMTYYFVEDTIPVGTMEVYAPESYKGPPVPIATLVGTEAIVEWEPPWEAAQNEMIAKLLAAGRKPAPDDAPVETIKVNANRAGEKAWVTFVHQGASPSSKTQLWDVIGSGGPDDIIGEVNWSGPWRQYVFQAAELMAGGGVIFNPACLRQIAEFVESMTADHRASKRTGQG